MYSLTYKVPTIEKPCIRECCLTQEDVCVGCFRTLDNMRIWHKASQEEKKEMLDKAKQRKKDISQL